MDKAKLADLVLDFELYPRNEVSSIHVTTLADAFNAGATIPPILADRKSRRVTDGFHRYRMHERLGHETVEVVWKDYKTEKEMFADAVSLNAAHGRSFDPFDRRRAVLRLAEYGYTPEQISAIAHVPAARLTEIEKITATIQGGASVVVKGGLRSEFSGERLTKAQEKLNDSWSGMNPAYHARQLVDLLKAGVAPKSESFPVLMDELVALWKKARMKKAS